MSDLRDLYQETILDHARRPRNFKALGDDATHAEGHNPLCGDRINVWIRIERDRLAEISFEGAGCAICTACASMMTERLRGQTVAEAYSLADEFKSLVTSTGPPVGDPTVLGQLAAFTGVREFPMRIKCATLPWHAMRAALKSWTKSKTESPTSERET